MKNLNAANKRHGDRNGSLGFRSLEVRSSTVDVEARTVEAVVATDTPVPMFDYERWEVIPEVLRADGVKLPSQVPLLDSHSRASMRDQLGSVRDLRIDGGKVLGRLAFASKAGDSFDMVREGHATDVSAGYAVLKRVYVEAGKTKTIGGREYIGPVNVVTKWRLREVSLTPIGADEAAKLRALREEDSFLQEGGRMDEDEKTLGDGQRKAPETPAVPPVSVPFDPSVIDQRATAIAESIVSAAIEKAGKERERKIAEFRAEAESLCKIAGREDLTAQAQGLGTRKEVEDLLINARKETSDVLPLGVSIRAVGAGVDRFVEDLGSALTGRALENSGVSAKAQERALPADKRKPGADKFRHATLYQMAEDYVRSVCRVDTRGMSRDEVAIVALFGVRQAAEILGLNMRSDGAYHTTGSFANLTMDAVNKSLSAGYAEAPATWRGPMRQGSSVPDFKEKHVVRMGAIPNLPIWQDNKDPEKASFADAKISYPVESRSLEIGLSYRTLVNDDMDALSRVPAQLGNAAARTVNAVAWAQITGNPTMSDGQVLFLEAAAGNRKQVNMLSDANTPPSVAALQSLGYLIRTMKGENTPEGAAGPDVLALQPKYLVVPASLETVANQLVNSAYDPDSGKNTQVFNPTRTITPVVEPLLDSNSLYAWYLFADPSQIDTVELSFMQGQESPVIRQWMDPRNLSQMWTVLQTFAAKALNHRGIAKQKGEA